jgi:hypothetical protein
VKKHKSEAVRSYWLAKQAPFSYLALSLTVIIFTMTILFNCNIIIITTIIIMQDSILHFAAQNSHGHGKEFL